MMSFVSAILSGRDGAQVWTRTKTDNKLYKVTVKVVNDPGTGQLYSKVSAQQVTSDSPAEFEKFMRNQVAFWGKVTRDLDIKVEP